MSSGPYGMCDESFNGTWFFRKKIQELVSKTVRGVYWKAGIEATPITPFVSEYIERQRMRKLGFTSSFEELPYIKSMIFCMISAKIDDMQAEEMKKKKG